MAEWYGLTEEAILERIEDGENLSAIAASVGKNRSMLAKWLAAEENRSARARSSRQIAAQAWDELAQNTIETADDGFSLAKAKELAHHYRWRASKVAPKEYGDKIDVDMKAGVTVRLNPEDGDL